MNPIDDDTLQAYVDGQLDAEATARIDALLATDPLLAARVQRERALRAALRGAFDPVLDEPIPARLAALLQAPAADAPLASVTAVPTPRPRRRWAMPALAMAASIAALAVLLWQSSAHDLVRLRDGETFAGGALSRALDDQLASAPEPGAPITVGLTFRAVDGHICRSFVRHAAPARAGLACHAAQGWQVLVVVPVPVGAPAEGDMRQAASALPPAVQQAIDARLQGGVFDASQERAARDAGWR